MSEGEFKATALFCFIFAVLGTESRIWSHALPLSYSQSQLRCWRLLGTYSLESLHHFIVCHCNRLLRDQGVVYKAS